MKYKVVLFDLDHTLWDYEKNSEETLLELYHNNNLNALCGFSFQQFHSRFHKINHSLWKQYDHGLIDRDTIRHERFNRIFRHFKISNADLAMAIAEQYLQLCPTKTNLFPHTHNVLQYLKSRYRLYILTNGFDDVQEIKLNRSKLSSYFSGMITSETIGHLKPSREIFEHAVSLAGSRPECTIMIGDNLNADILGAQNASIDAVYFNPLQKAHKGKPNQEISCLSQLMNIL